MKARQMGRSPRRSALRADVRRFTIGLAAVALCAPWLAGSALAQEKELPKFEDVAKGYEKVISTADGVSFYNLWQREKDGQVLAELPRGYANQKHFFAMTIRSGELYAGLQGNDIYAYWKRFDDRMALIAPNIETRSTGDQESKDSVNRLFTDHVILDVPIACIGPNGQPVIDMDAMLLGNATTFFGRSAQGLNQRLASISTLKAFPENVEIAFQAPVGDGTFKIFHYSLSLIPDRNGYKPREADDRVGYFVTSFRDLGKFRDDEKWTRYINRWRLEKADPSLKLSPPKEPIVFYVEHTTPVRYRRFIRDGALYWNKAFEKIGIVDAIEVRFQDKTTGAHMEKDPEDVRYNFIRWLSNDIGTAIGPSRVNPETGQILDADVVLTDGWIRHFWYQYNELLPDVAMESFTPETLAWLNRNPEWDPRLRLAPPAQRDYLFAQRASGGILPYGGHAIAAADPTTYGNDEYDGLGLASQMNGFCMAARGKGMDMALMRMHFEMQQAIDGDKKKEQAEPADPKDPQVQPGDEPKAGDEQPAEEPKKDEEKGDVIDGVPDWFVGPMLADLVAHEVGHTLGLRHNFKASSEYTLAEINSEQVKGTPFTASVMDYTPVNINFEAGPIQGDYTMTDIGPYDYWAIQYGYTFGDTDKVLAEVGEPDHAYATDEDTIGPDPLARRYDFTANPIDYANNQMRLVQHYRQHLLDKFVHDGESWAKARRGYHITLGQQTSMLSMMANWLGGAYVERVKKGDPNTGAPIEVVSADRQRAALDFCIDNAFRDEAYGLTPEMLQYMTVEKWWDDGGNVYDEAAWPVHDRIMGIQASTLTMLLNPTTLKRVYDNEYRVPAEEDMVTLPEVMEKITGAIWSEVDSKPARSFTNRKPMVSSLRRNLQREHLERLIDLTMPGALSGAAAMPVATLATQHLRSIKAKIDGLLDGSASKIDAYTLAHLEESRLRIQQALDAQVIYNTDDIAGPGGFNVFMKTPAATPPNH